MNLDVVLDQAVKLALVKYRIKFFAPRRTYPVKITLKNFSDFHEEAVKGIQAQIKKLVSLYNKEVILSIEFDSNVATSKAGCGFPTQYKDNK